MQRSEKVQPDGCLCLDHANPEHKEAAVVVRWHSTTTLTEVTSTVEHCPHNLHKPHRTVGYWTRVPKHGSNWPTTVELTPALSVSWRQVHS